jgi:hypothetical protein
MKKRIEDLLVKAWLKLQVRMAERNVFVVLYGVTTPEYDELYRNAKKNRQVL